ncbi:YdbH domain-containing protein [Marinobacter sp.]|uniref:intermembrane phospholipid transport protein YdbH family protein n=1 Tax=Marinobacter sp. TaxID=50741 RepID=UPI00384D84EF
MTWRRIGLWFLAILLVALIAGALLARQAWHDWRQSNGVETLDWQGFDLAPTDLLLGRITLVQEMPDRRLLVTGEGVHMEWSWHWGGPGIDSLAIDKLHVELAAPATPDEAPRKQAVIPAPAAFSGPPPFWLPQQLRIGGFTAELPCRAGRCELEGSFSVSRESSLVPAEARLDLKRQGHRLELAARLGGKLPEQLTLDGEVLIDGAPHLVVESVYGRAGAQIDWSGRVNMQALPNADWLLDWLAEWQAIPFREELPVQPETGTAQASWQLQGPAADFYSRVSGSLTARAQLPEAWPLPGVGTVRGDMEVSVHAREGTWLTEAATADLELSQPAGWAHILPPDVRPETLEISIRPAEPLKVADELVGSGKEKGEQHFLPLMLDLKSRGRGSAEIRSHVAVSTSPPWVAHLGDTRIRAKLPGKETGDWVFSDLSVDLSVAGRADHESLYLDFSDGSVLNIAQVTPTGPDNATGVERLLADLSQLNLTAAFGNASESLQARLRGPLEISAERIDHPLLHAQPWGFDGDLEMDASRLKLVGVLASDAGARISASIDHTFGGALVADVSLEASGEKGSEALSGTLTSWPPELTVSEGTLAIPVNLKMSTGEGLAVDGRLKLENISGIYDRMALNGLEGEVEFHVREEGLTIDAPLIRLEEVNPGIPIGPATAGVKYTAAAGAWAEGRLELLGANAEFLGGEVWVAPNSWDLDNSPWTIPLVVDNLELSRLMTLYPAENLSGTGKLSGQVPVLIAPGTGVRIEGGELVAHDPGGVLKLPADRLRGISQDNQALELVARAVENFHYSVLDSRVQYDQDGTLHLDLHIEGRNPEVQGGRPIVLNIDLEEDIPALLTSLQLSGRVNEAITRKVRKLLEDDGAPGGVETRLDPGTETDQGNLGASEAR